jgi:hypothetical protein
VLAKRILDNWRDMEGRFVKVMPIDYRSALERMRQQGHEEQPVVTEEVFLDDLAAGDLPVEEVLRG